MSQIACLSAAELVATYKNNFLKAVVLDLARLLVGLLNLKLHPLQNPFCKQ